MTVLISVIVCDCRIDCLRQAESDCFQTSSSRSRSSTRSNQETQAEPADRDRSENWAIVNWKFVTILDSTPLSTLICHFHCFQKPGEELPQICASLLVFRRFAMSGFCICALRRLSLSSNAHIEAAARFLQMCCRI